MAKYVLIDNMSMLLCLILVIFVHLTRVQLFGCTGTSIIVSLKEKTLLLIRLATP